MTITAMATLVLHALFFLPSNEVGRPAYISNWRMGSFLFLAKELLFIYLNFYVIRTRNMRSIILTTVKFTFVDHWYNVVQISSAYSSYLMELYSC